MFSHAEYNALLAKQNLLTVKIQRLDDLFSWTPKQDQEYESLTAQWNDLEFEIKNLREAI